MKNSTLSSNAIHKISHLTLCLFISLFTTAQNDLCGNATVLTSAPGCFNTAGTLTLATYTADPGLPGCGAANADVWYSFVAHSVNPTITVVQTSGAAGLRRSQLFSGTCGTLTSLACSGNSNTLVATGLTPGQTYYVRVYSNTGVAFNFNICITDPNDLCGTAANSVLLSSGTSCTNIPGNMYGATLTALTINAPDCAATATYDVWYRFVAQTSNPTITLSNIGADFANPGIQLLSNNCGSTFTSFYCGTTSIAANYLVPGTTYFIRVYSTNPLAPLSPATAGFDICITDPVSSPPFNDECANAINLPIWNTCNNINGEMAGATLSLIPLGGTCTGPLVYDTWFKFTAVNTTATITLGGAANNFTNRNIEILSGACGSLTSIACGASPLNAAGLTAGSVYYVRVYSTAGPLPNGNARFTICATTTNAPVRFGNTYVNVTKKTTGGVVETGDILEIRMTVSHTSGTKYNLRFVDNVPTNTTIAPAASGHDSIWIRTNEGLTYKNYSFAASDDAGRYTAAPPAGEYNIRLNLGFGGTNPGIPVDYTATEFASATGSMVNTNNPRGGGGLLFAIAYRVQVTGNPGDTITLNPARFLYKELAGSGPDVILTATPYKIVISNTLGLCTNSIGVNYASESGGTFGSGASFNRSTDLASPIDRYTFVSNVSGSINIPDGRYAIVKNISPRSGTSRTARRIPNCGTGLSPNDEDHCNFRMFNGYWYVDGDHSGTNNSTGNIPPGLSDNGGYMLLVNADYVASEVYRQTITNLCPNTYYEFSAWVRNVCPTCGIDSTGQQFAGTATAPANGYPGVYPNLAFLLNDVDYYNTGEIDTTGWLKKGFVFKTGPAQTSATFSIRNNAQGGGGNDWALDDISVATCFPNMSYSPTYNPIVCENDAITIRDTVRSYYDNYVEYKWQRSTDGGASWTDIAGASGTASPYWNGAAYEFITSYTIPSANTTAANDGDLYRVVVASTVPNLSSSTCSYTDPTSITLDVLTNCGPPLSVDILSISGRILNNNTAQINWATSKEDEPVRYQVERSPDGRNFITAGVLQSQNNDSETNRYSFTDPQSLTNKTWYRVVIFAVSGNTRYSEIVQLIPGDNSYGLITVVSPFTNQLQFEVKVPSIGSIEAELMNVTGKPVRKKEAISVYPGTNALHLGGTDNLPAGVYMLRLRINGIYYIRKVLKN